MNLEQTNIGPLTRVVVGTDGTEWTSGSRPLFQSRLCFIVYCQNVYYTNGPTCF